MWLSSLHSTIYSLYIIGSFIWWHMYRFISGLHFVPLIYASFFIPIPCFNYYRFVMLFEIRNCEVSTFWIFFFFLWPHLWIWKFIGEGLKQSCSWGLYHCHSNTGSKTHMWPTLQLFGNARSLTHWAWPAIKPPSSWRQHWVLTC